MAVTYGQAKRILAQYAGRGGKSVDAEGVDLFCKQVFQYLLISGSHGNLRKFCFHAVKGCFTVPYELEAPLKVKINGKVGTVWNKWFEFYNYGELEGCVPASEALYEEPDYYPTAYSLSDTFSRVGVLGTAEESPDAFVIISGKDPTGREIVTTHNGQQIAGEYLRVKKGELHYTQVVFGEITSVQKSITNGYVQLYSIRPELSNARTFLSDYSPFDENPMYRRFKLTTSNCDPRVQVSVIGKIRIKDHYADNEVIPFDNLAILQVAGQSQNKQYNDDPAMAKEKDTVMQDLISRENEHLRIQPGSPIDVFYPLSAGSIKNII